MASQILHQGVGVIPVVGRGRIAIWEGASLWLLAGDQSAAELSPHAHHAIHLTFQLAGSFEIGIAGERLAGPITAVASDAPHDFRGSGAAAFLFVAPESSVGRALGQAMSADRPWADMTGKLMPFLDELREGLTGDSGADALIQLGLRILDALPVAAETALPDPRALAMIDFARKRLDDVVTLPAAADFVGLSESRARHLFVAQTGLPFKAYVLWLRLQQAVSLYAKGTTLTEAAHGAGFADSAHFSRTFKRTFGLPAATLRLYHG